MGDCVLKGESSKVEGRVQSDFAERINSDVITPLNNGSKLYLYCIVLSTFPC